MGHKSQGLSPRCLEPKSVMLSSCLGEVHARAFLHHFLSQPGLPEVPPVNQSPWSLAAQRRVQGELCAPSLSAPAWGEGCEDQMRSC